MADIDLIPAAYLKRQLTRRLVTRFLLAMITVAALVGGARVALNRVITTEKATVASLHRSVQIYEQTEAKADGFREQRKISEARLSQLDELRGRFRLRILLQAIDTAYNRNIWLDELRYLRRENLTAPKPPAGGAVPAAPVPPKGNMPAVVASSPSVEQRVEIVGHATDHTRLAEFMRSLGGQPGIADVRLLDTSLRAYGNTQVIDLSLTMLIDDKFGRPQ